MRTRKIPTSIGLVFIGLLLILSAVFLYLSSISANWIVQAIFLLVSIGLVFFSTHPLAHYVVARLYGARVQNFFIAPSDFRKLGSKPARFVGRNFPTIGTRLDKASLSTLNHEQRARIYGAGAIASSLLILAPLAYAAASDVSLFALILGGLFFLGNLAFEIAFSTKVGDLAKMKREYMSS